MIYLLLSLFIVFSCKNRENTQHDENIYKKENPTQIVTPSLPQVIIPSRPRVPEIRPKMENVVGYSLIENDIYYIDINLNKHKVFDYEIKARNVYVKNGLLFFNFVEPFVLPNDTKGCILAYVKSGNLRCLDREAILLNQESIKVIEDEIYYLTNNYTLKKFDGEVKHIGKQISIFEIKDKVVYHDYLRKLNIGDTLVLTNEGIISAINNFPDGVYAYKKTARPNDEIIRIKDNKIDLTIQINKCKIDQLLSTNKYGFAVSKSCNHIAFYSPQYTVYPTSLDIMYNYFLIGDELFLTGKKGTDTVLVYFDFDIKQTKQFKTLDLQIDQLIKIDSQIYYTGTKNSKMVLGILDKQSVEIDYPVLLGGVSL